jgi:hypothetical protein
VALSRVSAEGAFDLLRSCNARKRSAFDFGATKRVTRANNRREIAEAQESLWVFDRGTRVSPALNLY